MADVAAGFATHTSFIPVLSVLTAQQPTAIVDGVVRVASWNGKSQEDNEREVNAIFWKTLTRMDGYKVGGMCEGKAVLLKMQFVGKRRTVIGYRMLI